MPVEQRGFESFAKVLKKSPTLVRREVGKALKNAVTVVGLAAKTNIPTGATGALKRSVVSHVDEQDMIGIVGLDAPGRQYGIFVEKGTKPHWVPKAALERWAAQRNIPVYAVQRAIARKGTKPQPFMRPAFENNKSFINRQFTLAHTRIVTSLTNGN